MPRTKTKKIPAKHQHHSAHLKNISPFVMYLMSLQEPIVWLIDKSSKSILDVGCGQGLPMELLKLWIKPENTVGVDLFKPYIKEAKEKKIHDQYVICDILKMPFKDKSFDTVIALQVLEHQTKSQAWKLLEKMERIARKQVIVAVPIGEMYHPAVDDNVLQMHKSSFQPYEFEEKGYRVVRFGRKSLLGESGLVHKTHPFIRKAVFMINFLLTPFYFAIQPLSDYHVYAIKDLASINNE